MKYINHKNHNFKSGKRLPYTTEILRHLEAVDTWRYPIEGLPKWIAYFRSMVWGMILCVGFCAGSVATTELFDSTNDAVLMVFLLVIGILCAWSGLVGVRLSVFYQRYPKGMAIFDKMRVIAEQTEGTVIHIERTPSPRAQRLHYQFSTGNDAHQITTYWTKSQTQFDVGDSVCVLYLPDDKISILL